MTYRVLQLLCVLASLACAALQSVAQVRNLQVEAAPVNVPLVFLKPPPPNISDLVLLLQSYLPDQERVHKLREEMDTPVPGTEDGATLAIAWHKKATAAMELQDLEKASGFLEKALGYARDAKISNQNQLGGYRRVRLDYAKTLWAAKGFSAAQDSMLEFVTEIEKASDVNPGYILGVNVVIADTFIALGDTDNARRYLAKADAIYKSLATKPPFALALSHFLQMIEAARGNILTQEGKLDAAERAYLAAMRQQEESMQYNAMRAAKGLYSPPIAQMQTQMDSHRIYLAQALTAQVRLDESELLLREVLKAALVRDGRNSFVVGRALFALSRVFLERGRLAEAAVLAEWSDKTLTEAGLAEVSSPRIRAKVMMVNTFTAVGRAPEAAAINDALRKKLSEDSRLEEGFGQGSLMSIRAYTLTNRFLDALQDGDRLLQYNTRNFGADNYITAESRAFRASVLNRMGRADEARKEFDQSMKVLLDPAKVNGKQQASVARTTRLRFMLGENLNLLVGNKGTRSDKDIADAFLLADVARWQSVQKAVTGSALRSAAGTPELGVRIKKVQDADDELQAVYKNLISQRSAPPERQLPVVIKAMEERIASLQKEQQRDLVEIRRQFPQYDALVNPRPADIAAARKALQPNEGLLSIYVTSAGSYVWGLGPDGVLHFNFSDKNTGWVADQVKRLRDSVDLTTGISPDRMRFDLQAGSAIYQELLAPVEAAWDKADTLLVVANEALGQIPFSMLPTSEAPAAAAPGGLPLAQFRATPWLARKVAIAYLPSISNLVTLRALPAARGGRAAFIGYGDPDFGGHAEVAPTRGASQKTRNLSIKRPASWDENKTTAQAVPLAAPAAEDEPTLNALPDTRDEITAIATALAANLQSDTFFGVQANRQNVLSADLKRRRIVAFATHGLVAGDLPGLDQPALALSPGAGRSISDGLLKLEDILKLSLDADLVVLSACNTAAADGTGAEAVSGLGRGFFYAGARAVLATHWPVETVSARQLVTHLFERYSQDGKMTRAQALRRAMIELIDTEVAKDSRGVAVNAYAHPAFWAPYALYGDPGR